MALSIFTCCYSPNKKSTGKVFKVEETLQEVSAPSRIGLRMVQRGGVFQLPCVVNGLKMEFIFDTGASNVCLSYTEALFMYKNGYLDDADFIGESQSKIADGSIVEDMEINLKTVEVGGLLINDVKASIVKSLDAPLLLGQSAIQKLGIVEIKGDSLFITKERDANVEMSSSENESQSHGLSPSRKERGKRLYFKTKKKRVEEMLIAALDAKNNGMKELGIRYCDDAIELRKKDYRPYAVKGEFYLDEDNYGACIKELREYFFLNKSKDSFFIGDKAYYWKDLIADLAFSFATMDYGSYNAITFAQKVLLSFPDCAQALNALSLAYTQNEDYVMAEEWANKLLKVDREAGLFRLAFNYAEQGRLSMAISKYEEVLEINPNSLAALINLANLYMRDVSESWYDDGSYHYPTNNDYYQASVQLMSKAARLGGKSAQEWLKSRGIDW